MENPDNKYAPVWKNGKRETILYEMDTSHILNALRMYEDGRYGQLTWHYIYRNFWIDAFNEELLSREGELTRHPETGEFMSRTEMLEQRKLKRMILGLPPMKPIRPVRKPSFKDLKKEINPNYQSLFTDH